MNFYKHPLVIIVTMMGLVLAGLGFAVVQHQWLYSCELTQGVTVVQTPFKHTYDIYTPKGRAVEDVFGWVIRRRYLYGSYGRIYYFMINLEDWTVTHFDTLGELSTTLEANGLPRYHMNDEENTSHLKHGKRKYH